MNIVIARDGLELGSLPMAKARELIAIGFLRPTDIYWGEGMATWLPMGELPSKDPTPPVPVPAALDSASKGEKASWLSAQSDKFLNEHWPEIQTAVVKQTGHITRQVAGDDRVMTEIFTAAYKLLPIAITLIIREKTFVAFCLAQRDKLLAP